MESWHLALGGAIALGIGAAAAIAIEELLWLRRRGRLTRAALREMGISLSPLLPTIVVTVAPSG